MAQQVQGQTYYDRNTNQWMQRYTGADGSTITSGWNDGISVQQNDDGSIFVTNANEKTTIQSGFNGSNISVFNSKDFTYSGSENADTLNLYDSVNAKVDTRGGNDNIKVLRGQNNTVYGGNGSDVIYNSGNGTNINGGEGRDTITNYGSNSNIDGGDRYFRDDIYNRSDFTRINENPFDKIDSFGYGSTPGNTFSVPHHRPYSRGMFGPHGFFGRHLISLKEALFRHHFQG